MGMLRRINPECRRHDTIMRARFPFRRRACVFQYAAMFRATLVLAVVMLSALCLPQDRADLKLVLSVEQTVSGPYGGQKSSGCLRVYSDGKVVYARWWNSAATLVDTAGKKTRPEHTISTEYLMDKLDVSELTRFLKTKSVKNLRNAFGPPHAPIDYFENTSVRMRSPNGQSKQIITREYYVASLDEKVKYPSALIVLMDKIDEIERLAEEEGKPVEVPADCHLKQ